MKKVILLSAALAILILASGCQGRPAGTSSEGQQTNSQSVSTPETDKTGETVEIIPASDLTETQAYLADLAKTFYLLDAEFSQPVTEQQKASFFLWYISQPSYEETLEEWKDGEVWRIPLYEIDRIVSTHLDTKSISPLEAFRNIDKPDSATWYDSSTQEFVATTIGGYGGAAALEVISYDVRDSIHTIRLGSYDMDTYYQDVQERSLLGDYKVVFEVEGQASNYKILSAHKQPEKYPTYSWADAEKIDRLNELQAKADIKDEAEIKELAGLLLDKAWYLCYLAYEEPYIEEGQQYTPASEYIPEEKVEYDGAPFYPVTNLPYESVDSIWKDIYSIFDKTAADENFRFVSVLYADIDGKLYCNGGADGQSKGRLWDINSASINKVESEKISIQMDVTLIDNEWRDYLEIVFIDGRWILNQSYFASNI